MKIEYWTQCTIVLCDSVYTFKQNVNNVFDEQISYQLFVISK